MAITPAMVAWSSVYGVPLSVTVTEPWFSVIGMLTVWVLPGLIAPAMDWTKPSRPSRVAMVDAGMFSPSGPMVTDPSALPVMVSGTLRETWAEAAASSRVVVRRTNVFMVHCAVGLSSKLMVFG